MWKFMCQVIKLFVFIIVMATSHLTNGQNDAQQEEPKPGYYLVTNAFSKPENAVKWKAVLTDMGFEPRSFMNLENGLTYIYIAYETSDFMLRDMLTAARELPLLKETWIKQIK